MSYRNGYTNGHYGGANRYDESSKERQGSGGSGAGSLRAGGYGAFYDGPSPAPAVDSSPVGSFRRQRPTAPPEHDASPAGSFRRQRPTGPVDHEEPSPQPSFRRQRPAAPSEPEESPQPSFRRPRLNDSPSAGFARFAGTDDYDSSRSRDRRPSGQESSRFQSNGSSGRGIDGVLEHINQHWDIMTRDDCVPVHVALQLMDYSSLGRGNDYQDFQKTNKNLQKALKTIVNEHHQGFNSSIGAFHKIQTSIQTSQSRVRDLKDSIKGAKTNLMVTKPELKIQGTSSQKYDEMLQILGQIEKLQIVPEQLDARVSEKHFLPAVDLLQDALRMIRKSEMENIGALMDLRIYFSNQETSMTDILIEELHDHLYLKSPYCHDRWKPYAGDAGQASKSVSGAKALPNTWGRPLYRFLDHLETDKPLEDDASKNPETDSFEYMHMVIEALNKLGHLDVAVDRMEQRLPVELFAIVDRTNQEVELRHASHIRIPRNAEPGALNLDLEQSRDQREVLNDLLWTLYSKFEAIAEGHRVVHDVVAGVVKRDGLRHPKKLTRGFKEMWKLYQSEMRSLLHDYLATDGNHSYRLGGQQGVDGNIFHRPQREKNKRVFKLAQIDQKTPDLATDQRDLDQILQTSVPGLVSKNQRQSGIIHNVVTGIATEGPAVGHKLLVDPNVFNIASLLPPSLSFLQRLRDIVPHDTEIAVSTLTSFLDEFIVNVFHPQLEDTVTELCTQSFVELEAFQQYSQWSQQAQRPIFKADLTSTQLIISQVLAYYDKCCEWYKTLVRRPQMQAHDEMRLKTAAAMADSTEFRQLVDAVWKGNHPGPDNETPMHKECKSLITKTNETRLEPYDIISDPRSVRSLCLLYSSLQWLASRLEQLRQPIPDKPNQKPSHTRNWSLINNPISQIKQQQAFLPMTSEAITAFDQILSSIRALATTALFTLHIDIRLGILHMLNRTLAAPYLLSQVAQDPDPSIIQLNADILSFSDTLQTHLPPPARNFITSGLSQLVDTALVSNVSHISHGMNEHGCRRMQLNILVLSQNLKSIETTTATDRHAVELDRSDRFFELFAEGAESVVIRARDRAGEGLEGFDLEELKALVELWYREGTESSQREVQVKAKRDLGDRLLILSECLWNR